MAYTCPEVERSDLKGPAVLFPWPFGDLEGGVRLSGFDPAKLSETLKWVWKYVLFVREQKWSKEIKRLDVTIEFRTPVKHWCSDEPLGPCACNTGYTDVSEDGTRVIRVYRQQDWLKVLAHELIHAFQWDLELPHVVGHVQNAFEASVEAAALLVHNHLFAGTRFGELTGAERKHQRWLARFMAAHLDKKQSTNASAYLWLKWGVLETGRLFDLPAAFKAASGIKPLKHPPRCVTSLPFTVHQLVAGKEQVLSLSKQ